MIAVVGGSAPTDEEAWLAEEVGRGLATSGAVLICGGRGGVMEAACKGAKFAAGLTVGVLPGTDFSQANPYVDIPIVTGLREARNAIIARTAQAMIAIGGSYGTLSEIALALRFGTPVISLRSWWMGRDGHPSPPILRADTPEQAVTLALSQARSSLCR